MHDSKSINETHDMIIHNMSEYEVAVNELKSLNEKLEFNKARHERQLNQKIQNARNMTSQVQTTK